MFVGFFYLLRQRGFGVSLNEWMTLMEGLSLGLHRSTLTGFYDLCRAVLVKSEADYDKFDAAFLEYFKDVPFPEELLPDELMDWLNHPKNALEEFRAFLREQGYAEKSIDEILKMFEERLREQTEEHNGGSYWIGTGGYSNFGNAGHSPQGIRVGGESIYRRAFQVAGERKYRDFRRDNTLDIRQFQMAFRLLRQYSDQSLGDKTEFDVDGTIRDTCDNAGTLKVRYKRPRRNTVKVLMLMDSGGNSGSQASVTIIRALSTGEVEFGDILRVMWKELRVSVLCGFSLAAATFVKILLVDNLIMGKAVTVPVALVVCITLCCTIIIAKLIGCTLPMFAEKIGFDPAVMASPFITTIVDAVSLLIYFTVAKSILSI